jgi:hypothetical protein
MMSLKGGSIWAGYAVPYDKLVFGINVGQRYLMENTTLGIPALIQSEGSLSFLKVAMLIHLARSPRFYKQWHYIPVTDWPRRVI